MNWVIEFRPETLRELEKLDPELKRQVVARLESRLIDPELPKARLSGAFGDTYKIKLKRPESELCIRFFLLPARFECWQLVEEIPRSMRWHLSAGLELFSA